MKITAIHTFICHAYRTNWVFVKVLTDVPGLYGVGEATLEYRELTVAQACQELERDLKGKDPRDIEAIWHDSYRDAYFRGGPVLMSAISAIDMALWDILGKEQGLPVYRLLGGPVRDCVSCYVNGWFVGSKTPDDFAKCAARTVDEGFTALKWDPFGAAYRTLTPGAFREAIECVQKVFEATNGRANLLIEGHGRFDFPTALRIANALEDFDVLWFEEPLIPDSIEALAELKSRTKVPIACGERLYNRWQFSRLFELHAADFIQPDISHAGGISELKKIAAMAETYYIPICPHNPSGPVANAATLQLAANLPNFYLLETMQSDVPWRREICTEDVRITSGMMQIPTLPGLGVDIHEEEIAKHPYKPTSLRHYRGTLVDIRPDNARPYY
ncbi:MAG: galactonate dehydratase [Pirellulales bacterium]|nr:galactonate dehydratase [Pirellulales bacterium]